MVEELKKNRIRSRIGRTHARLIRLRLFEAFAMPVGMAIAFLALVLSGIYGQISPDLQIIVFLFFSALIVFFAVRGLLRLRLPGKDEAKDALDATHPERPLAALTDRPVRQDAEARKYWDRHKIYLSGLADALRPPRFSAEWRKLDPLYLRGIVPVLLLALLGLNATQISSRLSDLQKTDIGALFGAENMEVTAWLSPPGYTGNPPVFLDPATDTAQVPQGTVLTVRVHGPASPRLNRSSTTDQKIQGDKTLSFSKLLDGAYQIELPLNASQDISLTYWGRRAFWSIVTDTDNPPTIRFGDEPSIGEKDALSFVWSAEDDYGIANVFLNLVLAANESRPLDEHDQLPIELALPLVRTAQDTTQLDLTRHKWAGLEVEMTLEARDANGQSGFSDPIMFKLPEKLFLEPVAKASQEIRLEVLRESQDYQPVPVSVASETNTQTGLGDRLTFAPDGLQRAALMLDAVTYKPEFFFEDLTVYLGLRRAHEMLRFANEKQETDRLDDLLWSVALRAEYGTVADAARRLAAARKALESALRDGAPEEEIQRLMQAFREAAEDYIAARMAEALANPGSGGQPGGAPSEEMLGGNDLSEMLDALEDLTETGASDAARQLLSDVTNLLNNLNFQSGGEGGGSGMPGDPGESDENIPAEEQELQGALDKMAEILEEQRRLNDDTLQERFGSDAGQGNGSGLSEGQKNESQNGESLGEGEQSGQNNRSLAQRQSELLQQLEAYARENSGDEGEAGEGTSENELDSAGDALRRAENALRRGDLGAAQWNQDQAIQDLREAAGGMSGELDELRRARKGENGRNSESDPLGRPGSAREQNDADGVEVPDKLDRQRARDILDDLRRRLNESTDPAEREYLQRLLDRF